MLEPPVKVRQQCPMLHQATATATVTERELVRPHGERPEWLAGCVSARFGGFLAPSCHLGKGTTIALTLHCVPFSLLLQALVNLENMDPCLCISELVEAAFVQDDPPLSAGCENAMGNANRPNQSSNAMHMPTHDDV